MNSLTTMRYNGKLLFDCAFQVVSEGLFISHLSTPKRIHFISIAGQCEYLMTPDATLPNTSFLNPECPAGPITIKLTRILSA